MLQKGSLANLSTCYSYSLVMPTKVYIPCCSFQNFIYRTKESLEHAYRKIQRVVLGRQAANHKNSSDSVKEFVATSY